MPKLRANVPNFDLVSKDGQIVMLSDVALWARTQDESVESVGFAAEVKYRDWEDIDNHALFGLTAAARGPIMGGAFDPEQPVRIECVLRPDLVPVASALVESEGDLPRLATQNALQSCEAWLAMTVTQEGRPGVRFGFQTSTPSR